MPHPLTEAELADYRTAVCRRMLWLRRARQRLVTRGVGDDAIGLLTKAAEDALHALQVGLHYQAVEVGKQRPADVDVAPLAEPSPVDGRPDGTVSQPSWRGHRAKGRR